jgi:hypothetical protein
MTSGPEAAIPSTPLDVPVFTSLDPPETNPHCPQTIASIGVEHLPSSEPDPLDAHSPTATFRHSGWAHDRRRVYDSFRRTAQTSNRLRDFRECGKHAFILQSVDSPEQYLIGGSTCHDRFCLPCARERSRVIATNVIHQLEKEQARFMTLTLKSASEPLANLLSKLTADFTALRRSKLWRNKVTGGVAFIEVKWKQQTQRWHPHLHCLVQGRYVPQAELSKLWLKITGTSKIVDIRFARDSRGVTHYVTKYASKPFDHTVLMEPNRLDEAVLALKGKRLCLTFGKWRGLKLTERVDAERWLNLGSLTEFIDRAEAGDQAAATILRALEIPFVTRSRGSPLLTVSTATGSTHEQSTFSFNAESRIPWDVH